GSPGATRWRCPGLTVHAPGRGYEPRVRSTERCEVAALRVGGARRLRRVQKEVEGYAGRSRNYFLKEVTCVPSWGTFQIPTPLRQLQRQVLCFLCPGSSRRVRAAGPQSHPGRGRKRGLDEPPEGVLSGLELGELVTQAPTSKHVPPPPRSAGRRRFSQNTGRESPSWSHSSHATHRASQRP
ncbi:killin, partial [Daubentonia madagascariensis]